MRENARACLHCGNGWGELDVHELRELFRKHGTMRAKAAELGSRPLKTFGLASVPCTVATGRCCSYEETLHVLQLRPFLPFAICHLPFALSCIRRPVLRLIAVVASSAR